MSEAQTGAALRLARKALGLSVAAASELVDVSASTIKRWEAGQGLPRASELERYLDRMGAPPEAHARSTLERARLRDLEKGIGERPLMRLLRSKRRRRGITLQEISDATGLSVPSLHRYETGCRLPNEDLLPQLAMAYGCDRAEATLLGKHLFSHGEPASSSVVDCFLDDKAKPHFWLYRALDAQLQDNEQPCPLELSEVIHGFVIMGDHKGLLEAWHLLRPRAKDRAVSTRERATISLSLTLAQLTVTGNKRPVHRSLARWCERPSELSPESTAHVARLCMAIGEYQEAEMWLNRLDHVAAKAGYKGLLFASQVNRLVLTFDTTGTECTLQPLQRLAEQAQCPLQRYTAEVALLYVADRLGQHGQAYATGSRCQKLESAFGFGSPLARSIRARRTEVKRCLH